MGFWHTGYIEFHETTGLDPWTPSPPKAYPCSYCEKVFDDAAVLRHHRFEAHPFKRPSLFIRGTEVGSTPLVITHEINSSDVDTGECATAIVNGLRMSVDQVAGTLASTNQDTVWIILEGDGATATFEIRIDIASNEDLFGVENAFLKVVRHKRLDLRAIEQFIDSAVGYKSAARYCDGICEYLYGVLAKERSPASSLPYEAYREKFTRAMERLGTFDRPLAKRIGGLIEFHFNHFPEAASLSFGSRVGRAAEVFSDWLSGESPSEWKQESIEKDVRFESLLTDWDTEQLIRWAVIEPSGLTGEVAQMGNMLHSAPAEFDQTKLHILLAQIGLSSNNPALVLTHARRLRNSPSVGHWADEAIKTCRSWGGQ